MISFSIIFSTTSSAEDENTKKKKRAHAQTKKLTEYERNDSHNDPLQVGSSLYGFSPEIKLTMTLFFFFSLFLVLLRKSHRVSSHVYVHVWLFVKVQTIKRGKKWVKVILTKTLFPEQSRFDDRLRVTTKPKCAMSRQEAAHLKKKNQRLHLVTSLLHLHLFLFFGGEGDRIPIPCTKVSPATFLSFFTFFLSLQNHIFH